MPALQRCSPSHRGISKDIAMAGVIKEIGNIFPHSQLFGQHNGTIQQHDQRTGSKSWDDLAGNPSQHGVRQGEDHHIRIRDCGFLVTGLQSHGLQD